MIKYYKPCIGDEEKKAVERVLDSGWLTTGAEVKAFEEEFAQAHGCKYALAVSSATAGLHLASLCSPYVECKVPNYTFIATIQAAFQADKSVRIIGTQENGYNATFKHDDYGTVIAVHIGGEVCDIPMQESSRAFVIEDCAHRFPGGNYKHGPIQVFSFYANKPITCGEGGIICTNDYDYYMRMKEVYYHGMDRNRHERGAGEYSILKIGYKYNMTDIQAAIGREQLKNIDLLKSRRQEIANKYIDAFAETAITTRPKDESNSWHLFIIELGTVEIADTVRKALSDAKIEYGRHYQPLTTWDCVREKARFDDDIHKKDTDKYKRSISLPIYVDLTDEEQSDIIDTVRLASE